MKSVVQKIDVCFEYPVVFTESVFSPDNPAFFDAITRLETDRNHRFYVVIDDGVADAWPEIVGDIKAYAGKYPDHLELAGEPEIVAGGEGAKSDPALLSLVQKRLYDNRMDRQSFVVIIGGGAVQDMAGYAAATVHRGLRTLRLPTTVLSQNDSGVGVKNGINAFGIKNFLGTFWPPFGVINDLRFIDTLTSRDKLAGIPEAVKVALIRDATLFDWLEGTLDSLKAFNDDAMGEMIRRGATLHMNHISTCGDPFEFGAARPLDFGHWSAHKLESLTDYELKHGEAVAIGMLLDAHYSMQQGMLDSESLDRIYDIFKTLGLPLWDDALEIPGSNGGPKVLEGLDEFREHLGGELTVTLLEGIGKGVEVNQMDTDLIIKSIQWLRSRQAE